MQSIRTSPIQTCIYSFPAVSLALGLCSGMPDSNSIASDFTSGLATYADYDGDAFATATGESALEESITAAPFASQELKIAKRILASLQCGAIPCELVYLERIEEIIQSTLQSDLETLKRAAGQIASSLSSARVQLLDDAPTAREWARLARIIDPDAQLSLPKRFIQSPIKPTPIGSSELGAELEAASWVRSII